MTATRQPNDPPGFPERKQSSDNGAELIPSADEADARRQAEEREFDRVYGILHRGLAAYARFKCGTKDDADDVMQTVWLKAHQQHLIARYDGDLKRIAGYLREMVRNQAIDDAVHERSRLKRVAAYGRALLTRGRKPETPYEYTLTRDIDAKLAKAIRKLPPRCADVLFLVRYSDMSYDEVAKELGISVTTVAAHLRTAKVRLKNDLADFLPDVDGEGKEHAL